MSNLTSERCDTSEQTPRISALNFEMSRLGFSRVSQGSISPWSNRHEPTSFFQDVVLKLDELLTFQPRADTGPVHDLDDSRDKAKAAPSGRPPLCPAAPGKART